MDKESITYNRWYVPYMRSNATRDDIELLIFTITIDFCFVWFTSSWRNQEYFRSIQSSEQSRREYIEGIKKIGTHAFDKENECSICFFPFKVDQELVELPCSDKVPHLFHFECLDSWIENGGESCPLCRKPIKRS